MRTPAFLIALALAGAAGAAGAAQAQSLELERHRLHTAQTQALELERHRLDMERHRIEQDLRALQAAQFRLQTQMSGQAVRDTLYTDVPPIPLVSGGVSGFAIDPAAAEQARQRAEQERAKTVQRRLQDIRGGPR